MKKREIRRPFVRQFYKKNKLNFTLAFAATVVMAFANLVISWLLQQIMDLMAGSGNTLSLGGICWVLLGIVATIVLVGAIRAYALPRFFTRAMGQYKDYAYSQLLKKNISTFSRESTSTYLSALSNDANSIEVNYLEKLFDLVMDAIQEYCDASSAAVQAVQAGNDLLCCSDYETQYPAVLAAVESGELSEERIEESALRVLRWKEELGLL